MVILKRTVFDSLKVRLQLKPMFSVFVQAHSSSFIDVYLDAACSAEDMYRVIFHPQMVSVCEKVNYAVPQFASAEPG